MTDAKPRYRVKSDGSGTPKRVPSHRRMEARYLRGDRSGILNMRKAVTRDAKVDVRESAERAAALAIDFMHNSGWISGAITQILCDTVGEELKLTCRARLLEIGYSEEEAAKWCRNAEEMWRRWAWNPKECDLAGKATIADMTDATLRSFLASGESFGILDTMDPAKRRRLGLQSSTKVSLVASHRCPRISREVEGLDQGVFHDEDGRAIAYRFRLRESGIDVDRDIDAADVIHVMDRGEHINSPRGITVMAPALKVVAQSDQLADGTLATTLMRSIFAATIKSPEQSDEAFKAITTLADIEMPDGFDEGDGTWSEFIGGLQQDLLDVWQNRIGALKDKGVSMNDPARINHLGPGEEFELHTADTPGSEYVAFFQNLLREIARCLGVTFESLSMDHSNATYSSVLMSVATIWPIVMRRRARIVIPFLQAIYERWLEEMIETGKIRVKGGREVFRRDRERFFQAEWIGPAAPSADKYKAVLAEKIELELGISTYSDICASRGRNGQEQIVQLGREKKMFEDAGIPHPFGRTQGGAGPQGAATEGMREPAKEAA